MGYRTRPMAMPAAFSSRQRRYWLSRSVRLKAAVLGARTHCEAPDHGTFVNGDSSTSKLLSCRAR